MFFRSFRSFLLSLADDSLIPFLVLLHIAVHLASDSTALITIVNNSLQYLIKDRIWQVSIFNDWKTYVPSQITVLVTLTHLLCVSTCALLSAQSDSNILRRLEFLIKRAVSRSSSTSRTYEAWSSRATYLCARNCGSSFSVPRENVQPNKECLAEHSALSLTILRKAWLSPQPRGEVSPRTDDVSGLRDFRIPRVTCCLSRYLNIQMLLLNLSWRRYRRLSSISIPFHRHRYIIVLRLIDSYSLSPPRTAWTYI